MVSAARQRKQPLCLSWLASRGMKHPNRMNDSGQSAESELWRTSGLLHCHLAKQCHWRKWLQSSRAEAKWISCKKESACDRMIRTKPMWLGLHWKVRESSRFSFGWEECHLLCSSAEHHKHPISLTSARVTTPRSPTLQRQCEVRSP